MTEQRREQQEPVRQAGQQPETLVPAVVDNADYPGVDLPAGANADAIDPGGAARRDAGP